MMYLNYIYTYQINRAMKTDIIALYYNNDQTLDACANLLKQDQAPVALILENDNLQSLQNFFREQGIASSRIVFEKNVGSRNVKNASSFITTSNVKSVRYIMKHYELPRANISLSAQVRENVVIVLNPVFAPVSSISVLISEYHRLIRAFWVYRYL
ncbi:hypothetical protein [Candidatus Sarmatiella mevalonica]|uniref:hypothetical protein n=1 Tax=Candidatus Sarmatiella mevalonica TaxID=2770581 RepID=UPI001920D376|nr:hypothetical protein [Candidatus Sarmatiella mevalonica]